LEPPVLKEYKDYWVTLAVLAILVKWDPLVPVVVRVLKVLKDP
jgi:hypothetical protein